MYRSIFHIQVGSELAFINSIKVISLYAALKGGVKHQGTPGPLYNMVSYNTVLTITLIIVGFQLIIFSYMFIHFTLIITWFG